jgi:hypothetical protein
VNEAAENVGNIQERLDTMEIRYQQDMQQLDERHQRELREERETNRQERQEGVQIALKRKRLKKIIAGVLLAIATIIIVVVFAVLPTQAADSNDETQGLTVSPSTPAPTNLFEPSQDFCQAVANGDSVEGQSEMFTESFIVSLEATLQTDRSPGISDEVLLDLKEKVQERLMTILVGCPDLFDRRNLRSKLVFTIDLRRYLQEALPKLRNAQVDLQYDKTESCNRGKVCIDIKVHVFSYQYIDSAVTAERIETTFIDKNPLETNLKQIESFSSLILKNVDTSQSPTESPSLTPTTTPTISFRPTFNGETRPPTKEPSAMPSHE